MDIIARWFEDRLPREWFDGDVEVTHDDVEILVVGRLPQGGGDGEPAVADFREATRGARIEIAREAEDTFRRKVSWGVRAADATYLFTNVSAPVMTRLRLPERRVLDTLVAAGVARSRSDALNWCVRLVGRHEKDWLATLREAMRAVDEARAQGPKADRADA